jgi:hypothetical protein
MIELLRQRLPERGIATLHYERFSAPAVSGCVPFEIELARFGRIVRGPLTHNAYWMGDLCEPGQETARYRLAMESGLR